MTYEVLKCPHCKHKYEERVYGATRYRSPFLYCVNCHQTFVDKNSFEPALFTPQHLEQTEKKNALGGGIYVAVLTIFPFIGCVATGFKSIPWIIILAFVAFLDILLLACKSTGDPNTTNETFKKDYIASLRRLCDIDYAQRLKSLGFSVPSIYLNPNCELLSEIRRLKSKGDNATPELNDLYSKIRNTPSILR